MKEEFKGMIFGLGLKEQEEQEAGFSCVRNDPHKAQLSLIYSNGIMWMEHSIERLKIELEKFVEHRIFLFFLTLKAEM